MPTAKLFSLSTERMRRQDVKTTLEKSAQIAKNDSCHGAIVILRAADGRTIIKTAGTLHKRESAIIELLQITLRASLEQS